MTVPASDHEAASTATAVRPRVDIDPVFDPGGHRATLRDLVGEGAWVDGVIDGTPVADRVLIRRARQLAHPDHRDGDQALWDRVQVAADGLRWPTAA
jgi:hypothetical protein